MSRLSIRLTQSKIWLDVPESAQLKFTINNAIFYESGSSRDYSLSENLPLSPTNNKAFSWMYMLGAPNSSTAQFDAQLFDDHIHIHNGILEVRRTTTSYSVNFQINNGTVDLIGKDKSIRDIPAFDVDLVGIINTGNYPAHNTVAVHSGFYGLQDWPQVKDKRMMYHYGYDLEFVYLFHVIKEAFNYCGWQGNSLTGSFMSDAELQQLHFLNVWWTDPFVAKQYHRLPNITVTEMLDSLRAIFNIGIFYDSRAKTIKLQFLKDIINTTPIDWSDKVDQRTIERDWGQKVMDGLTLQWEDKVYQTYSREDLTSYIATGWQDNDSFLDANNGNDNELVNIRTENTAFVWFKPNWWYAELVSWWPVGYLGNIGDVSTEEIIGEYNDFGSLPSAASNDLKLALVINENWYYRSDGSAWNKYTYRNYKAIYGNGKRVITSKIAAPIADRIGDELELANLRTVAMVKRYGSDYAVSEGAAKSNLKDMPAMLSFNRGAGVDSQGNIHQIGNPTPYHTNLSTPDIYDYDFNQVGNYRLGWEGDNGLFETFHRPWYEYVNQGQEITFMANLTHTDLNHLDLSVPIRVHGITGFIRQIKPIYPLRGLTEVTIVKRA